MCSHEGRNRTEGWIHAKRSGHKNEDLLRSKLLTDFDYQSQFLSRIGIHEKAIRCITGGGLGERHVPSIFADARPTTSKTDLYITLTDGSQINISVKKSPDTQAYLVKPEKFIEAFEKQYNLLIPPGIKRAMQLYWGTASDTRQIINAHGTNKAYELRKNRLTASTLSKYNQTQYDDLLRWFKENGGMIANICLSKGGALNPSDWAEYIWHKNVVDPEYNNFDEIIKISDIEEAVREHNTETSFSTRNGGSTIRLPFGFVQWHDPGSKGNPQLQFHLELSRVHNIISFNKIH